MKVKLNNVFKILNLLSMSNINIPYKNFPKTYVTNFIKYNPKYTIEQFKDYILSNKDRLNISDNDGNNCLMQSLNYNYEEQLEEKVNILIDNGINIDHTNKVGVTALMITSCNSNNCNIIKKLIHTGANVNKQDNQGKTALMYAIVKSDNIDIVELLIKAECELNLKTDSGRTALMLACEYALKNKHNDTIEILLNAGADKTLKNNFGETALMVVIKYLWEYNYSIEESDLILLLKCLQTSDTDIENVLMFVIRKLCDSIHREMEIIHRGIFYSYNSTHIKLKNQDKYEKLIKLLLYINSSTNEKVLIYLMKHLTHRYLMNICMMLVHSPLNLSLLIDEKTISEWICIYFSGDIVKYCFEKNIYNEYILLRCIKIGNHKEILVDLLSKLLLKKTIYFKLYL